MKKSFTLIELIVVIAIIAVLAAIIAPNAFRAIEKAKVSKMMQDMKVLKTAGSAYYADIGLWPPDVCPNDDPGLLQWDAYQTACCGTVVPANVAQIMQQSWDGPYLESFPQRTPWAGSYDWELWPLGGWTLPPGCYVSARPQFDSSTCAYAPNNSGTEVPVQAEVRLQQQGVDVHLLPAPATVDDPSGLVIFEITQF